MGTRREKILQKVNPKLLKMTPRLSGDSGSFIDLESDNSLEDGARKLMVRFFRNQDLCERNKRNSSQNVTELTIASAKYNENNEICELVSERLTLPIARNDEDDVSEKPGRRLQKLKMELQEKMSAKWEEEYKKRVSENKLHNESRHKHKKKRSKNKKEESSGADSDGDESLKEEKDEETKECTKKVDEEEEYNEKDDDASNGFGDDEEDSDSEVASVASGEQSKDMDCELNTESNLEKDDDLDDSDGCSLVPAYQPGGGMLYGGSELTQTDDGLPQNLLSPSLSLSINESSGSKILESFNDDATPKKAAVGAYEGNTSITEKAKLFSQIPNNSFDLSDAFEFCSGKFPDAEDNSESQSGSQNHFEDNLGDSGDENEDEDGCDDNSQSEQEEFEQGKETSKSRKIIAAFEDSEEEEEKGTTSDIQPEETEESYSAAPKLLSDDEEETAGDDKTKTRKKTRQTLHFSDEEDATNDGTAKNDTDNESDEEENNGKEEEEGFDDCEERSIHYDSEENEIINPKEFFEKEAELSGSEWSGDEDERGLDVFDVEEGDADKLDSDQVRSQLEKIHIRRVLDDDAREVRLIQEILFEDGDLHSDGKRRDRKFKWKNLGTFDEEKTDGEPKEEGGNSSEDEGAEEEKLRKLRHERELFLMTKKKNGDLSSDDEIVEDFHAIKVTSIKTSIKLPVTTENTIDSTKTVIDCTKIRTTTNYCNARGSFLARNEEFLSRLAKATSGVTDNVLGPKSSKNFVFAAKSPEKRNPEGNAGCKRQVNDSENCSRREKKIKLLPREIDTGPSILDLLA